MVAASKVESAGRFLLRRLEEFGLSHVFGVAGDFNLEFLELMESDLSLRWVGQCNELNAAYAADGYARTHDNRWLRDGDHIRAEIEWVGLLEVTVHDDRETQT